MSELMGCLVVLVLCVVGLFALDSCIENGNKETRDECFANGQAYTESGQYGIGSCIQTPPTAPPTTVAG